MYSLSYEEMCGSDKEPVNVNWMFGAVCSVFLQNFPTLISVNFIGLFGYWKRNSFSPYILGLCAEII